MSDEKIFNEMAGIFAWIKSQKKPYNPNMTNKERTFQIIKDFMVFLQIDCTNDEINALNDLANVKEQPDLKFETFYNIFFKSKERQNREKQQLQEVFLQLLDDKTLKYIPISQIKKVSDMYNDKYQSLKDQMIESFKKDNYCRDGNFYFEEYLNDYFSKV